MENSVNRIEYIRELISDCRYDDATDLIQRAIEEEPDNIDYNYELARVCMDMGNYPDAISNLELVADGFHNHLIYFMLAEAYQADGQIDRAIGAYLKALMLNEKFAPAYKKLAILFLARNDKASAAEYLEDYMKMDIPQTESEETRKILNRIKGG